MMKMKTKHGLNIVISPKKEIKFSNLTEISSPYDLVDVENEFIDWNNPEDDELTKEIQNNLKQINLSGTETVSIQLNGEDSKGTFCFKITKNSDINLYINRNYKGIIGEEIRLLIEENSKVKVFIQEAKDILIQRRYAKLGKNSKIEWNEMCKGEFVRTHIYSELVGNDSESKMNIKFYCNEEERHDCYAVSIHKGKKTKSSIITKGICEGKALSRGLVRIEENAKESEGYETLKILLLKGEADAIPNLEILNHDVKCSHGASISNIDEEAIFYFQSRGITEKNARKKIMEGFLNDN